MFNRKKSTQQQVFNYAKDRLQKLNLDHEDGFDYCSGTGDILIQYHCLNGDRAYYHSEDTRATNAIEAPEQFRNKKPYRARRYAPAQLTGKDNKYNRPAAAAIPFITLQVRQLFKSSAPLNMLVFPEGEFKAAFISKNFNIPAIAFAGISNYRLNADIKKLLIAKQPPVLVFNYDSDARDAGNKKRLASFYSSAFFAILETVTFYRLQGLELPQIYICIQNEQQPHKGIDDLLQANGTAAAREFKTCRTSEFFDFLKINTNDIAGSLTDFFNYSHTKYSALNSSLILRAQFTNTSTGNRTRLTDILQANNLPITYIFGNVWEVPTGTGKTTAIIKAAALEKVAFFAPLLAICDQVLQDAKAAGIDAIKYTGNKASQQHLADRLNSCNYPQMIVCTYASAESLQKMLKAYTKVYHLVIDEFHSTTAATSPAFMLKQLNGLLDSATAYRTITGLTGTPLLDLHPVTKNLQRITVKLTGEPRTTAELIKAVDPIKAAADKFKISIEACRLPIVLFNNKKEGLTDLLELLKDTAGVTAFNADKKECAIFQNLISTGLLSDTTGLISTTVLEMGINNNTATDTDVIILGNFHPVTIKQFKERNRLAKCTLTIIQKFDPNKATKASELEKQYKELSETDKTGEQGNKLLKKIKALTTSARYVDRDTEAVKTIKQAESICTALNLCKADITILDIRKSIQCTYIREVDSFFIPDYLAIQNAIFELEKYWLNSNPERLLKSLSEYGFDCYTETIDKDSKKAVKLNITTYAGQRTADDLTAAKVRRAATKAAKAELFEIIAAELTAAPFAQITAQKKIDAKATEEPAREFYQMYLDIRTECKSDLQAAKLFTDAGGKEARAKLTILRLKTQRAKFDSHQLGNAPAALQQNFAVGQTFTADNLRELFLNCIRTDKTINIEPFEKCKRIDPILKKLRMFFEVVTFGDGGTSYKIEALPPEYN
jgi:hypothetical protein